MAFFYLIDSHLGDELDANVMDSLLNIDHSSKVIASSRKTIQGIVISIFRKNSSYLLLLTMRKLSNICVLVPL